MRCFLLLVCAFLAAHPAQAQVVLQDTTSGASAARVDTLSTTYHPTKSPAKAMLFSAILPGAGQFYNQSYWKVPVVLGFGIYFVANWFDNNRVYRDYRDQYKASLAVNPAGNTQVQATLLTYRDFYSSQRDAFAWYFLILYFINIADAYVDASLFDFNVGGDLTLRQLPGGAMPEPPAAWRVTLHVHL